MRRLTTLAGAAAALALLAAPSPAADKAFRKAAQKDVKEALDEIEKAARKLLKRKDIDWKAVKKDFTKRAKEVEDLQDEYELLVRLVACARDGHAGVYPAEGVEVVWPGTPDRKGTSMFWTRSGDDVLVKNSWGGAQGAGVLPGMRVVEVDGVDVDAWIDAKVAEMRDTSGYSTDHQAEFAALHWGLSGPAGELMALELRRPDGKRKKARVPFSGGGNVPFGPAVFPEGLERIGRQSYGTLPSGFGYIHLRDVKGELPEQLDTMLASIGNVPGLVLDCRANGGGGCDHAAVFGRFVPAGKKWKYGSSYESAGPTPYAGPMVVIVDAGVRSAGETVSGQFKEDGRAYMIGPAPTAGMSSSKTTIELPSGKFSIRVSVASNKGRFNGGEGIEGIGVPPHEIVPYDADALAEGIDPLIQRAEELLKEFPQDAVRYEPEKHGWSAD
jgi:C-terminal processing protease CtpA/Prc